MSTIIRFPFGLVAKSAVPLFWSMLLKGIASAHCTQTSQLRDKNLRIAMPETNKKKQQESTHD